MNRKQILKATLSTMALALAISVAPMWGQNSMGQNPGGGMGQGGSMSMGHHQMPSAQERTDRLAKQLNLSSDQKAKVLSAYQDEDKKMSALRSDTSSSGQDKFAKMKEIHEDTASQIKSSLNPDQAKQFDAMEQKMMEEHHRGGGMGMGQQPPQQ
jgi:Spy/CpxP family protein refolding chaperone